MKWSVPLGLAVLVLAGCGRVAEVQPQGVHPFSDELRKRFVKEAIARGVDVDLADVQPLELATISSNDPSRDVAGICRDGSRVFIDMRYSDSTADDIESLAFHEWGHCVLGRSHHDDSLMAAKLPSFFVYWQKRTSLLDELFR